ncbi:MAG: zinc-binding alcohol dehydrogenase family protein [Deltaproteobacteria bacterium]|nr:zinc-binding alcohol dehydrogenase family protein [Deltaproteobacteria bacterium]MBW1993670.1 zinc-binding alcohol dehydrogenase family protein [Deltaproteobacteria bacterium]MBW2151361.1 zinc-binding alcohol dehydrogenase family protein [Deltaproteobacteria bacterium]
MKVAVCQKPYEIRVEDLDRPVVASNEALLRIRRIGICGSDLHAFRGEQPYFTYPRILGHELAGMIESAPLGDHGLRKGDPVAVVPYLECGRCIACRAGKTNCCVALNVLGVHSDGGMKEYISIPADHLVRADGLDWDQIALVECLAIGAHAVRRANIHPSEYALVIGTGPIGMGVLQFARVAGARLIAMDISDCRLEFCKTELGIDQTIPAGDNVVAELKKITRGDFPTVVFDATGSVESMGRALGYLSHGGRLIYVGLVKGDISINDPEFHKRETTLLASRNATREDFVRVIEALQAGEVTTSGFVTHRAPLEALEEHFESWARPGSGVIKAMVEAG